jgi:pulcherriminic acid synthase
MTVSMSEAPDILSEAHGRDPYSSYRILLEDFPVVFHPGTSAWLVSRHEDITRVMKSKEMSSEHYAAQIEPVHGRTIIQLEGKEHTMHRRLLAPFFRGNGLEAFKPTIEEVAESLVARLVDDQDAAVRGADGRAEVDLSRAFFKPFPITVIERMLALPSADHENFSRWYRDIMGFIGNLAGAAEPIALGLQARKELTDYFLPLIDERRKGTGTDLLTLMCQAEVDGDHLTREEVRAFVSLMLVAGGETTDGALGNMFMNLIKNPDQLAAVYEDRSLIVDAFAETLRHTPPVHLSARQPLADIELGDVTIPAGATIFCMIGAANRDPRKFADPERFDIFRTDNDTSRAFSAAADHLGFINGRHFCVGAMLAKAEIEIGANAVLDRMTDLRFADGFVPQEAGLFTRGLDSLRVTFIPA